MKSFTSLEQSKKLAEILPLESADMHYNVVGDTIIGDYQSGISSARSVAKAWKKNPDEFAKNVIPCWSLAALLEEMPEVINFDDDESDYALEMLKENNLYYLSYGNPLEHSKIEIEPQEYFVDACVAIIEKLHEQKLL